jgi:hypothetical protein
VFFDSTYTAEYLTTHRDFYLHVEQDVFVFVFVFFSFVRMQTVRPSSPEGSQLTVRGGGFLLSRVLLLLILLVVHVFVVYISLPDDQR